MSHDLKISIGQHSDKGRKESNQDFHGALIPEPPTLGLKGIAIALADGISSSNVSRVAAESAVKGFLTDGSRGASTARMSSSRACRPENAIFSTSSRNSSTGRP
jgi:serine/threonine protein phosphatase PrpC